MTPEERQMLAGLFDRVRGQAGGPRDADAEAFINDEVRRQPYAPYLLAQTVLVQQQGLTAANDRIQELEAQVRSGGGQRQSGGSFLGDIGRSIFGGGQSSAPPQQPPQRYQPPPPSNDYQQRSYAPPQSNYGGGPWGQQGGGMGMAPQRGGGGGGSFLSGALGAAAGVAGGVLLADSMKGLFSGHSATAATMAGGSEPYTRDMAAEDALQDQEQDQDEAQDAADDNQGYASSDTGGGNDDSFDV